MNAKRTVLTVVLGLWAACAANAQNSLQDRFTFLPGGSSFAPNEWSMDLFGYHASRDKGGADRGAWGPGVGVNYFMTDYVGLGADSYSDAFTLPYLLNGSVELRYPFREIGLAPYVYGGAGRQWDHAAQWLGHMGVGLEYRFNPTTGVMLDVRHVFAENRPDYTMVRFGLRFVF